MATINFFTMENQQTPSWKHSLQYGIGIGFILIIISLVMHVLDINAFENRWVGWIGYIVCFAGMTIAMINFRNKQPGGYISYGKSFTIGFLTALFAGILVGIYMVVFMSFAGGEFVQMALENAEQQVLERNPNASDQEIEMALKFTKMFMKPILMGVFSILGYGFFGAIYSLIASIFIKKENPQDGI